MKKILNIYSFLLIIAAILVTACEKNIQDNTAVASNFSNSARVQVFNAVIAAARNFVYVDGNQINGASIFMPEFFRQA